LGGSAPCGNYCDIKFVIKVAVHHGKETIMLILTRRAGETLMIGDDTQVTVLGVKGN